MNDLNTLIVATSTAIDFATKIILDPLTPPAEAKEFQGYKDKLTNQQKINVATLASNCE